MNLNYVLYASLDRSMAYFLDRISRQYDMIQRVPKIHNFESGLCEYSNFEAQKSQFSQTANSPAGPKTILEVHQKCANMVLEMSKKLRGSRNWSWNIFWKSGTPGKASGAKKRHAGPTWADMPAQSGRTCPPRPGGHDRPELADMTAQSGRT
ncbi:hypothetical protein JCGZ_12831 [Jatropha curcas]|uniref:Uncharacterized protein n=1 Tax=Jatropha curcas TaxID=180498 RepID=A0A067KRC6_JATCU|nr:hypothetical protein JCGZ_12831 [Jatropha curcas]